VIEGFPRSANTFAVNAFQLAQPGPVRIAHHLHEPAHVLAAVGQGVPTVLLVRPPEDTIVSSILRKPALTIRGTADRYERFHGSLMPVAERLVVADFEQVTTDFGAVIRRLNGSYGTAFTPFDHTDENVARCFALIDSQSRARPGVQGGADRVLARPTEAKGEQGRRIRERLAETLTNRRRERLREIYAGYRALALRPPGT
jgi:hypothetical protein